MRKSLSRKGHAKIVLPPLSRLSMHLATTRAQFVSFSSFPPPPLFSPLFSIRLSPLSPLSLSLLPARIFEKQPANEPRNVQTDVTGSPPSHRPIFLESLEPAIHSFHLISWRLRETDVESHSTSPPLPRHSPRSIWHFVAPSSIFLSLPVDT